MRDKAPKHKGRGGAKKSHGVFGFSKKKLFYVVDYYIYILAVKGVTQTDFTFFVIIFTEKENGLQFHTK